MVNNMLTTWLICISMITSMIDIYIHGYQYDWHSLSWLPILLTYRFLQACRKLHQMCDLKYSHNNCGKNVLRVFCDVKLDKNQAGLFYRDVKDLWRDDGNVRKSFIVGFNQAVCSQTVKQSDRFWLVYVSSQSYRCSNSSRCFSLCFIVGRQVVLQSLPVDWYC